MVLFFVSIFTCVGVMEESSDLRMHEAQNARKRTSNNLVFLLQNLKIRRINKSNKENTQTHTVNVIV